MYSWEEAKNYITPVLCKKGTELNIPKKDLFDFSCFYTFVLKDDYWGIGHVKITNDILKSWKIDINELHETAMNNLKPYYTSLFKYVAQRFPIGLEIDEVDEPFPMFIISNEDLYKGSSLTLPMPKGRGFLLPAEVIG